MTPRGLDPEEGGPDDDTGGASEHIDERELFEDVEPRGWVDPEDRLWRHPSELASRADTARDGEQREDGAGRVGVPTRFGRRHLTMAIVGTGAAAAIVVGIVLMEQAGTPKNASNLAATTSTTTLTLAGSQTSGSGTDVPAVAADARRAMVSLAVTGAHGVSYACGLVVQAGGLVVTTADAVAGAAKVTAMAADGRTESATVVATDPTSDLALLKVPEDLPTATMAGDSGLTPNSAAMVLEATPVATSAGAVNRWSGAVIQSVGQAVPGGGSNGVAGIEASTPSLRPSDGALLLDRTGAVVGILDGSATTGASGAVYLPTGLVVGVSGELASAGHVSHGWLDMEGHDAVATSVGTSSTTANSGTSATSSTTTTSGADPAGSGSTSVGALVVDVEPSGVSAGALKSGDVVVAMDGSPVRSMAELRSLLYVLPPGTPVHLTVLRGGQRTTVTIDLSSRS